MGGAVSDLSNRKKIIMAEDNTGRREMTGSREEMTHADLRNHTGEEAHGILNTNDLVEELTTKIQSVSLTGGQDDDGSRSEAQDKHQKLQKIETKLNEVVDISKLANQIQNISVTGELDNDNSRSQEKHLDEKEIPTNLGENVNSIKSESDGEATEESTHSGPEEESDADSGDASDENDKQEIQPIVPLPPLVQEEDEVALLTIVEYRAKLFRFDSTASQWKERGLGSIRLLESVVEPNKYRVVMWRESIGTLACNFSLFPDIVVKNFQDDPKVLCWQCLDCSDESPRWETLTCRFGNEEKCSDFKNKMLQYAKLQAAASKDEEKDQEETVDNSCEGCRGCDTDAYKFPEVPNITQKLEEPLIDCTLGGDSYSGSPCLLFSSMLTN
ncbi:unnamed protein product [Orchesella dallaii]|uniref:RanBD1 domain-containing protein n=1 Tax=Orchesella dallaii TaxID=48710 RepID=A0ABP1R3U3_9HEXA